MSDTDLRAAYRDWCWVFEEKDREEAKRLLALEAQRLERLQREKYHGWLAAAMGQAQSPNPLMGLAYAHHCPCCPHHEYSGGILGGIFGSLGGGLWG